MPTPALTQIQAALAAQLTSLTGIRVYYDRQADEAVEAEERPALIIRFGQQSQSEHDQSTTQHDVGLEVDLIVDTDGGDTMVDQINLWAAKVVQAIHADWTLGGRLQNLVEHSVTPDNSHHTDLGNAILALDVTFFTPRGNWFAILGQSQIFT